VAEWADCRFCSSEGGLRLPTLAALAEGALDARYRNLDEPDELDVCGPGFSASGFHLCSTASPKSEESRRDRA
jgi:hypothetical protein